MAKLTYEDKKEIVRLYDEEHFGYIAIAKQMNVGQKVIDNLIRRYHIHGEKALVNQSTNKFTSELRKVQSRNENDIARYSGINFMNTGSQGKNTIEFRLANGTIDPDTWIENINLFGGLVKSAQELAEIQKKPENERTEERFLLVYGFRAS